MLFRVAEASLSKSSCHTTVCATSTLHPTIVFVDGRKPLLFAFMLTEVCPHPHMHNTILAFNSGCNMV